MSIVNNSDRVGNFTSSQIYALTTLGSRDMTESELLAYKLENPKGRRKTIESWPGEKAQTYISEKIMERRLGRSLSVDVDSRATTWGKFLEPFVFKMLPEYTPFGQTTFTHSKYNSWKGSPDGLKRQTIGESKCPVTPKSFCQLVQPIYNGLSGMDAMNAVRKGWVDKNGILHKPNPDAEKFYWQIVSNCCIHNCKYGELIVFMPYKSQLPELRLLADGNPDYYHIWSSTDEQLPFLPDNGYYKNLNIIRFEIPPEDKTLLEGYVVKAINCFDI